MSCFLRLHRLMSCMILFMFYLVLWPQDVAKYLGMYRISGWPDIWPFFAIWFQQKHWRQIVQPDNLQVPKVSHIDYYKLLVNNLNSSDKWQCWQWQFLTLISSVSSHPTLVSSSATATKWNNTTKQLNLTTSKNYLY